MKNDKFQTGRAYQRSGESCAEKISRSQIHRCYGESRRPILSLPEYYSDETEIQWMNAVGRRLREVREGKIRTIAGEEIMAEMQRLIEA